MSQMEKTKSAEQDSEDEELSENEERNLENILVLFPYRSIKEAQGEVDDLTFEKVKNLLKCPVCLEIYSDPVYIKECMHRFCRQCIERIIRSQQNKACPFCRIQLGSKRILRNDFFTESVIKKIFPNLQEYLDLQQETEQSYFTNKMKELQEATKKRRKDADSSNKIPTPLLLRRDSSLTEEKKEKRKTKPKEITQDEPEKKKKVKKTSEKEVALIEEPQEKKEEEIKEEKKETESLENYAQKLIEDETLRENLKHLIASADLTEMLMNLEVLTPFVIEPLPSESYLKHFDNQVIKTSSSIKIGHIAKFICRRLNLNEQKYCDKIHLWAKKENSYEILDKQGTLKEIGKKYWSHLSQNDLEMYDLVSAVEEYLNKTQKPFQSQRILYYSLDIDDLI